MVDVAEDFTAMDTSHANFGSQHHSSGLPCYSLFKLSAKGSSGVLKVLSNGRFITSIFTGSDKVYSS